MNNKILKSIFSIIITFALTTSSVFSYVDTRQDMKSPIIKTYIASPKQPPGIGDAVVDLATNSATDPFSTGGGSVVNKGLTYLERLVGEAKNIRASINKAEKGLTRLLRSKANIEKSLSKLKKGSKAWNRTMRTLNNNAAKIAANKSKTAGLFSRLNKLKGLKLTGTALSVYGMYTDSEALLKGEYKHNHSSMRFLRDTLLGSNVAINGFLLTPWGQVPIIKQGGELFALGVGVSKDFVTSDTFAQYMNSKNNKVLEVADDIIDNTNEYWTDTFEGWITSWYEYTGVTPTKEQIALAEQRHQQWLDHRNQGLGRKPGDNVGAYKPNIYIYPEENMAVSLEFKIPGLLEAVIPEYPGKWEVLAQADGSIRALDGITYDYLFYESMTWPMFYQVEDGWLIHSDTRLSQMHDILYAYGFNEAETKDFTDYWTLKLDENFDYMMYPQLTATVDLAMPIEISPQPNTLIRIWFVFEKEGTQRNTPIIHAFERNGYTVVEWGGVILK